MRFSIRDLHTQQINFWLDQRTVSSTVFHRLTDKQTLNLFAVICKPQSAVPTIYISAIFLVEANFSVSPQHIHGMRCTLGGAKRRVQLAYFQALLVQLIANEFNFETVFNAIYSNQG